jgi:hypothetical protein
MSQDDDQNDEMEVHELYMLLSILKAQDIDINEYLRGLILASHMHYLWGKTTRPPPSTITITMTMMVSTTPILSKIFC